MGKISADLRPFITRCKEKQRESERERDCLLQVDIGFARTFEKRIEEN